MTGAACELPPHELPSAQQSYEDLRYHAGEKVGKDCKLPKSPCQDPAVYTALEQTSPSARDILGRTEQTSFLSNYLTRGVKGRKSGSLVVHGPAESGKTLTVLSALHQLSSLMLDARTGCEHQPAFMYLPCKDTPASAWCLRILHAIKTLPKEAEQKVYTPKWRKSKKKMDRQKNLEELLSVVTNSDTDSDGPGMYVVILDNMEKVAIQQDTAQQMQDVFAVTKAQGSRLILIAISHTEQLAELGLHEVTDLHFPPYTANQIRAVIESQLSGHDGVICPKAIKHLSKQDRAVRGSIPRALGICKNALHTQRQLERSATAGSSAAAGASIASAQRRYCILKDMMRQAVIEATPEMTSEEIVQRKRQRMAVDESLGDAKDPAKIKQIREEVLCPALQYSNFELAAMTDQLDVETFQDPVPLPEGADDWDRSHSVKQAPGKDGCMLKLDPDASPKKDAAAKLCSLDKLEDLCCSGFEKELSRPLYGDSFYSAYDRLVTCGILRRSISRNNGNTMLQLMSQEWHLRAAFDGNSLLHQLYDRFRDMLNPFEWV